MKHLFPLFVQNIFKIQYSSHIPFNSSAYIRISYFIQIRFSSLQKSHKSQNPIDTLRPSPKPNSTIQKRNATNIIFTLERISGEVRRHVQRRNSHRKQKSNHPRVTTTANQSHTPHRTTTDNKTAIPNRESSIRSCGQSDCSHVTGRRTTSVSKTSATSRRRRLPRTYAEWRARARRLSAGAFFGRRTASWGTPSK